MFIFHVIAVIMLNLVVTKFTANYKKGCFLRLSFETIPPLKIPIPKPPFLFVVFCYLVTALHSYVKFCSLLNFNYNDFFRICNMKLKLWNFCLLSSNYIICYACFVRFNNSCKERT